MIMTPARSFWGKRLPLVLLGLAVLHAAWSAARTPCLPCAPTPALLLPDPR
jgi:hypothetical protein